MNKFSPTKVGNLKRAKVPSSLKGKLGLVKTQKHTQTLRGIVKKREGERME